MPPPQALSRPYKRKMEIARLKKQNTGHISRPPQELSRSHKRKMEKKLGCKSKKLGFNAATAGLNAAP